MPVGWKNHIASDPEILRGKPRIKGTRIPVGLVLGYLAAHKPLETLLRNSPISRAIKSPHVWTMPAHWLNLRPSSDGLAVPGRPPCLAGPRDRKGLVDRIFRPHPLGEYCGYAGTGAGTHSQVRFEAHGMHCYGRSSSRRVFFAGS